MTEIGCDLNRSIQQTYSQLGESHAAILILATETFDVMVAFVTLDATA